MPWTTPSHRPVGYVIKKVEDWDVIVDDLQYLKDVLDNRQTQPVVFGDTLKITTVNNPQVVIENPDSASGAIATLALYTGPASSRQGGHIRTRRGQALCEVIDLTNKAWLTIFNSGGVYIGNPPTDPGGGNLTVQGVVRASDFRASTWHSERLRVLISAAASSGQYVWTFATPFTSAPTVVVAPETNTYTTSVGLWSVSTTSATIRWSGHSAGVDLYLHARAEGPGGATGPGS